MAEAEVVTDNTAELVQLRFQQFLESFSSDDFNNDDDSEDNDNTEVNHSLDYVDVCESMRNNDNSTLFVDFHHVQSGDTLLAQSIELDYYRYEPYLRKAVQSFVYKLFPEYVNEEGKDGGNNGKEFFVSFFNMSHVIKLRDLRSERVGKLVSINGTVTRTSEVRPELLFGTFKCIHCSQENAYVEQQFRYTEPKKCMNETCGKSTFELDMEKSKFVDWQRIRVQENSDEIPPGSMPRSMDVIVRHEVVDRAKAGDKCTFTGTLIVIPEVYSGKGNKGGTTVQIGSNKRRDNTGGGITGLKDLGVKEMTYKLAFLACSVKPAEEADGEFNIRAASAEDADEADILASFSEEEKAEIASIRELPDLYTRMAKCISPNIFGHESVKRGILLMLFGGVHKKTSSGTNLRGDINICVVGDPSTAKSKFLQYVVTFLPRAIYTSGKASTAAGLTASIARDPDTGEFCIEAGALMLADNGICCIDEFDKMDKHDQVAIHEAMEQQTISITKAGIQATLNARASILAAANPINGRYDRSLTLKQNIAMSGPIMSRFDLFFVVLDEYDEGMDYDIATHIVKNHQRKPTDLSMKPELSREQLQRYIKFARSFNPVITPEAQEVMVQCYRELRMKDMGGAQQAYRITVRQLESMIRLSEGLARLHLDDEIRPEYVQEAFRLLRTSIIHVEHDDVKLADLGLASKRTRKGQPEVDDNDENIDNNSTEKMRKSDTVKQPIRMSYEKYQRIHSALVFRIRSIDDGEGIKVNDLIHWHLDAQDDILGDEALEEEASIVENVIKHAVLKDRSLIFVEGDGEVNADTVISVHPNYFVQ